MTRQHDGVVFGPIYTLRVRKKQTYTILLSISSPNIDRCDQL